MTGGAKHVCIGTAMLPNGIHGFCMFACVGNKWRGRKVRPGTHGMKYMFPNGLFPIRHHQLSQNAVGEIAGRMDRWCKACFHWDIIVSQWSPHGITCLLCWR